MTEQDFNEHILARVVALELAVAEITGIETLPQGPVKEEADPEVLKAYAAQIERERVLYVSEDVPT